MLRLIFTTTSRLLLKSEARLSQNKSVRADRCITLNGGKNGEKAFCSRLEGQSDRSSARFYHRRRAAQQTGEHTHTHTKYIIALLAARRSTAAAACLRASDGKKEPLMRALTWDNSLRSSPSARRRQYFYFSFSHRHSQFSSAAAAAALILTAITEDASALALGTFSPIKLR